MYEKEESRLIEFGIGFGTYLLEMGRTNLRNKGFSFSDQTLDTIFHNSGDFLDGYLLSLMSNVLINKTSELIESYCKEKGSEDNKLSNIFRKVLENQGAINITSASVASTLVYLEETIGVLSTPDPHDIPAGLLGVIAYSTVRHWGTRIKK